MPFISFASPLSAHTTLTIGGVAGSTEAESVVAATSAAAWLNLLPSPTEAEYPEAALKALGIPTASVSVVAPHGLTLEVARSVLAAVKGLPPGPL